MKVTVKGEKLIFHSRAQETRFQQSNKKPFTKNFVKKNRFRCHFQFCITMRCTHIFMCILKNKPVVG